MSGLTYLIGDVYGYWEFESAGRVRCFELSKNRLQEGKRLTKQLFESRGQASIAAAILNYKYERIGWELAPYPCGTCKTKAGAPGWHLRSQSYMHNLAALQTDAA